MCFGLCATYSLTIPYFHLLFLSRALTRASDQHLLCGSISYAGVVCARRVLHEAGELARRGAHPRAQAAPAHRGRRSRRRAQHPRRAPARAPAGQEGAPRRMLRCVSHTAPTFFSPLSFSFSSPPPSPIPLFMFIVRVRMYRTLDLEDLIPIHYSAVLSEWRTCLVSVHLRMNIAN